jgi:hypothetical protein
MGYENGNMKSNYHSNADAIPPITASLVYQRAHAEDKHRKRSRTEECDSKIFNSAKCAIKATEMFVRICHEQLHIPGKCVIPHRLGFFEGQNPRQTPSFGLRPPSPPSQGEKGLRET